MKKRPTLGEAIQWALRVYRAALIAGEKGNWERANQLTYIGAQCCAFCHSVGINLQEDSAECRRAGCPKPVVSWCWRNARDIAYDVLWGTRTAHSARRRYRAVIGMLEKLDVSSGFPMRAGTRIVARREEGVK